MLTDGKRGSHDYDYNWFSFPGENLEVVIDLEGTKTVKRIESAYYQYGFWLRLFPKKVEYFISQDGIQFELVDQWTIHYQSINTVGSNGTSFQNLNPRNARYVKVKAYTIGNTPDWHPGAGRPARMLIDEIVVE